MRYDKKQLWFPVLIILLHTLWFAAGMVWRHFYNGDSYEYIYLAGNMRHGWYYGAHPLLPLNDFRMSLRTPVYSLFLLLCYTLAGYHTWFVLLLQNILSIASCTLMHDTFQKMPGVRRGYTLTYLLLLACYPAQMFFASTIAPDTLLQFFLVLYCRQLILSRSGFRPQRMAWMSLWLLLATLTKPIVYPFLFLHLLYAIYCLRRHRKSLLLLYGLLPLLAMSGYAYWNQQRTGLFHISSIQSTNLLHYNVKNFLAWKYGPAYADSLIAVKKKEQNALPGLEAKYEYASREAKAIIKAHPVAYSLYHLKESARFFIEPGKSELDLYTGHLGYNFDPGAPNFYKSYREKGLSGALDYLRSYPWLPLVLLIFLVNLLRMAGALLFLFNKRIGLSLRLLVTVYILYFAVVTGPVANARYFLPVLPVLSAAAAIGLSGFWEKRKRTVHNPL